MKRGNGRNPRPLSNGTFLIAEENIERLRDATLVISISGFGNRDQIEGKALSMLRELTIKGFDVSHCAINGRPAYPTKDEAHSYWTFDQPIEEED